MKTKGIKRALTLLLSLAMVITYIPATMLTAFADDTTGTTEAPAEKWSKVEFTDITEEDTVAITIAEPGENGDVYYALPVKQTGASGSYVDIPDNTIEVKDDTLTGIDSANFGWSFEALEAGGVNIGAGENYLSVKDAKPVINTAKGTWDVDGNYLKCVVSETENRYLVVYTSTNESTLVQKSFRAYKKTTGYENQKVVLWKLNAEKDETISKISDALAGAEGTEFKVKGVVTLVDGKSIYIQDSTGGICVYLAAASKDIKLGDTIIATGAKKVYNNLPELDKATFEASKGLKLKAKKTTIDQLTDADVCTYVELENLEVTDVYDKDGTFANPNITFKDETGKTIQLYKAQIGSKGADGTWEYVVGDKVTSIKAAIGTNKGTLQLRNTSANELVKKVPEKVYAPTATPAAGAVLAGTAISFSCKTDGASIMYKTGDEEFKAYSQPIEISQPTTFTVKATKEGLVDSEEVTFAYTIKEPAKVLLEKFAEIKDGDKVVIYNPSNKVVMGSAADGAKFAGVTAEPDADGKLGQTGEMALVTVGTETSEGTEYYHFVLDGKYLTSGTTGNSLTFEADLSDYGRWTIQKQEDGSCYIVNKSAEYKGTKQALEYYKGFTAYSLKDNNTNKAFNMDFYGLVDNHDVPDGTYVIYNPSSKKVMSSEVLGNYYLAGKDMEIAPETKSLKDVDEALVWTVKNNDEDGTITISHGKDVLSTSTKNSLPLNDVNKSWKLNALDADSAGNAQFYVENTVSKKAIEWYASKNEFSGYGYVAANKDIYTLRFVPAEAKAVAPATTLKDGDQVVIYNENPDGASASLGLFDGAKSLKAVSTTIDGDKAVPGNGARVFTVGISDGTYTFKSGDEYLATKNDETLFLTKELADDPANSCTYWTLTEKNGGYIMGSKSAKYNGTGGQVVVEFFAGAFSGWTYKATTPELFIFKFYPVAEGTQVFDGVVDKPAVIFDEKDAYKGSDFELKFTLDSVFDLDGKLTLTVNDEEYKAEKNEEGTYVAKIPGDKVDGEKLAVKVTGKDVKGAVIDSKTEVTVIDQPFISELNPERNAETKENKKPEISALVTNFGENPTVVMKVNEKEVEATFDPETGKVSYTPAEDMEDGKVTVDLTVTRTDGKAGSEQWMFWVGDASYSLYFGQLHSHTGEYSDGTGTLDSALDYISAIPQSANVQFVAFTDHSNYFDTTSAANPEEALYDTSKMTADSKAKWEKYNKTTDAYNAKQNKMLALSGFEMTWSGGPGHINTWVTPGVVSRNNKTLNNKTADAGMKAYYSLLDKPELADSISQFNHPGSTFGTFSDFAYYDPVTDSRMYMVEVGNGEGQIGQGGYYPSYEYYTMALDKGWHVSPTNNQDNHKGRWGNANDARDVIMTEDFTEEGLYAAIRQNKVYSTEDKNLEIVYTVNNKPMGTVISNEEIPEKLNLNVSVYDPDANDSISKVEVIVNSGKTVYTWDDKTELAKGSLSATLDPDYTYYYIRVTQNDGDIAVTSPVWVGESLKLGISSVECGTDIPVTGEELTLTTTLFNSEANDATVKSMTYTIDGGEVIGTDTEAHTVPKSGTLPVDFKYVPTKAKVSKVTVTAIVELDGKEYTFTKDIELDVKDSEGLVYFGIDGSHYNEYVSGNYKDSMGNFSKLASEYGIRTVTFKTSEELIAACDNEKYKGIIFTAPSRRLEAAQKELKTYTADELAAIKKFNDKGGMVVVAGWSDYYENYAELQKTMTAEQHMAGTQNALLETLGTSLRINDDATVDAKLNGGQEQRLYFNTYNMKNFLNEGVEVDAEHPNDRMYTEVYSQYGGCSIGTVDGTIPETVTTAVFGHESTTSKDSDNDGRGGDKTQKFDSGNGQRLLVTATDQQEGKGTIIVSGAAFMSNFEVQATLDNGSEKNYANYKVCENMLKTINPARITPIAEVQKVTEPGYKFTIQGTVTSNASGYQKETAFFDCIYVQDETGGICCFPVSGNYKVGDVVRISGTTDAYQGENELQVTSITKVGEAEAPEPEAITAAQQTDRSKEGKLVKVTGTIVKVDVVNDQVETIIYEDAEGNTGRIFIDGYITTKTAGYADVENCEVGNTVTAVGLSSYDNTFNAPEGPFPRIRIRNRADVTCEKVNKVIRIAGNSRYDTSLKAAKAIKEVKNIDKFDAVIIASGDNFADSLAGSYLSAAKNAPILLVNNKAPKDTIDYIKENLKSGGEVFILGGTSAVSNNIEKSLTALKYDVKRLGGATRYETNMAILNAAGAEALVGKPMVVCSGTGYADSLSASSTGYPIFIVDPAKGLTAEQKVFLMKSGAEKFYIAGGENAVSLTTESAIKSFGVTKRLGGSTRYETSILIAEQFAPKGADSVVMAYGQNYPDGLSAGPLAYALGTSLILTENDFANLAKEFVDERDTIETGYVMGGSGIISDKTAMDVMTANQVYEFK